jgi:hypothetical protein
MNIIYSTFEEASQQAKSLARQGKSASMKRHGDAWVVSVAGSFEEHKKPTEPNSIWVGKFKKSGAIVVFDYDFEVEGIDDLFGYVPGRDVMRQFEPHQKNAAHPVLGKEKDDAICKYMAWKKQYAESFIEEVIERQESTKQKAIQKHKEQRTIQKYKEQKAIQKHKEYLIEIGKPYSGVNLKTTKVHRVTHCYSCKENLDSHFHIECNSCGWLICKCGACGCGYEYKT